MELGRRWGLLASVSLAVGMAMFTSLVPFFTVEPLDFEAEQKKESRLTERGQYLIQLPLPDYIDETARDLLRPVQGGEWEAFLQGVRQAAIETPLPQKWADRISPSERELTYYSRQVHFLTSEKPLAELAGQFRNNGQRLILALRTTEGPRYFSLIFHAFSDSDFGFGSGLSHSPKPPARFLHPYRRHCPGVLLAGLALYILLPWPRKRPRALQYQRWRIILGDIASMILFVPFFSLPMLVIGGALQALTQAWILILILWPLAFAGVWLLLFNARLAGFCLTWSETGLELSIGRKTRSLPFSQIGSIRPLILRPPKWLIVLSWIGALAGRGSAARTGALGRALILSGSEANGIGLVLKDGSSENIWVSDQMGGPAVRNAGLLLKTLEKAGIPKQDEPQLIRSITLPEGETSSGLRRRGKFDRLLGLILITPIIVMILGLLFFTGSNRAYRVTPPPATDSGRTPEAMSAAGGAGGAEVEWERSFARGDLTVGAGVAPAGDGGFLLFGHCRTDEGGVDMYVARTDGEGRPIWEKSYGGELWDFARDVLPTEDGGFLIAGETRPMNTLIGKTQVTLIKTDSAGVPEWEKAMGTEGVDHRVFGLRRNPSGETELLGLAGKSIFIWALDGRGGVVRSTVFPADRSGTVSLAHAGWTSNGGIVATGELSNPGSGFKDLWLAEFDGTGNPVWQKSFGGKRKESGSFVAATADGGFIAVGVAQSFGAGGDDLYLVRTDAAGNSLWEKTYGTAGEESGRHVLAAEDGGFLVVGTARAGEAKPERIYIVQTDGSGRSKRELTLGVGASFSGLWGIPAADGYLVLANAMRGEFAVMTTGLIKIRS